MNKPRKNPKRLQPMDFAGDGEPYTEVSVRISIRILGAAITRSRLAVSVIPDPALKAIAIKSLRALEKDSYGTNEDGNFAACLSDNFNGWEDLDEDHPRLDTRGRSPRDEESLNAMNSYIRESVEWALAINKQGMAEAQASASGPKRS